MRKLNQRQKKLALELKQEVISKKIIDEKEVYCATTFPAAVMGGRVYEKAAVKSNPHGNKEIHCDCMYVPGKIDDATCVKGEVRQTQ